MCSSDLIISDKQQIIDKTIKDVNGFPEFLPTEGVEVSFSSLKDMFYCSCSSR